jgi:ribosomal protein S18 acetylase RimI-like enzyme
VTEGFQEISIGIPADVAWNALVAPGRRDWYYLLTAEGDFAEGKQIRWLDRSDQLAEESEVVEMIPPKRLVLRTRFTFAPRFAKEDPHTLTWEVAPDGAGCRVRMSWSEAFRDYPAWQACYCMETHRTQNDEEWAARTAADNRRDMSTMITEGNVTGLLAYADGKPVGWCNYGETTKLSGVMHKLGLSAKDHDGVGSVACFVIAAPYRGHGVAARLLDAAIKRLRQRGVRAVEAYPRRSDDSAQANYRGPIGMYLRAGFELYREKDKSVIVRKTL